MERMSHSRVVCVPGRSLFPEREGLKATSLTQVITDSKRMLKKRSTVKLPDKTIYYFNRSLIHDQGFKEHNTELAQGENSKPGTELRGVEDRRSKDFM